MAAMGSCHGAMLEVRFLLTRILSRGPALHTTARRHWLVVFLPSLKSRAPTFTLAERAALCARHPLGDDVPDLRSFGCRR